MTAFGVTVDPAHGGRITSLRDPSGHEWLWQHPAGATQERRLQVRPGAGFVDAGGIEECCPTVSGRPDHGDVWSRRWSGTADDLTVRADGFTLQRRIIRADAALALEYALTAAPGFRFVWALHALLRPDPGARVETDADDTLTWDGDGALARGRWPYEAGGRDVSRLGPDDGSAQFVLLPGVDRALVRQGGRGLVVEVDAPGQPVGLGLWRNLGGYAWDSGPGYRSFGVEPMLGDHPDLSRATACGCVPASGTVHWRVRLSLTPVPASAQGFGSDERSYDPRP